MKRILLMLVATIVGVVTVAGQNNALDYVFLKNGNVVKGVIESVKDNQTVSIRSTNGELYTYKMVDVNKLAYGETPVIPQEKNNNSYKDYSEFDKGFWYAVELQGGASCHFKKDNVGILELDVVGGYRLSEYLRIGLGLGSRYYFKNEDLRHSDIKWSYPVYLNIRGNIIPCEHRTVIPYYSFDIGGAIRDGMFFRPTIGIRVGEKRSAFLLGLSYMGQSLKSFKVSNDNTMSPDRIYSSFVTLKVGYEF